MKLKTFFKVGWILLISYFFIVQNNFINKKLNIHQIQRDITNFVPQNIYSKNIIWDYLDNTFIPEMVNSDENLMIVDKTT